MGSTSTWHRIGVMRIDLLQPHAAPTSIATHVLATETGVSSTTSSTRPPDLGADPLRNIVAAVNVTVITEGCCPRGFNLLAENSRQPFVGRCMADKHLIRSRSLLCVRHLLNKTPGGNGRKRGHLLLLIWQVCSASALTLTLSRRERGPRGYSSPYAASVLRSFASSAAVSRVNGIRNSPVSRPSICIAALIGIGFVAKPNMSRQSGNSW